MKKIVGSFILLGILFLSIPILGAQKNVSNNEKACYTQYDNFGNTEIVPYDLFVNSGSYYGNAFKETYYLKRSNGTKVNFWIKNKGTNPVTIKINGNEDVVVEPGSQDYTSASIGYFSSKYVFTANSPWGGHINIDFRIVQRD